MNAAAKRHRPTCMAPTRTLSAVGERLLRDSRSDSAVDGSNEHTSTRAHEHTSTRAHEHTSTRAHDTQPIPPQKNLTIRGNTSPATAQKYVTNTHQDAPPSRAAPQKTPHPTPPRPNRSPLHPKHPMSPAYHRGRLHCERPHGRFTTIDPRHAGDTPQSSAYGSNSPQATNENKPHHHDQHTKTCRTRPTQPPKEPTCAQTGHHSPINPTTTPHRDSSADSGLDHPGSTH